MLITTITGQEKVTNIKFRQCVTGVILEMDGKFDNERINAILKDSKGTDFTIHPNMLVTNLAEISALEEGFNEIGLTKSVVYLQIGYDGSIKLHEDQYINIELDGLDTNKAYKIYQDVEPIISNKARKFEIKQVSSGNTNEQVNLDNVSRMFLVKNDAFSKIVVNSGSISSDMDETELITKNRQMNDVVSISTIDDTQVFGFSDLLEIPFAEIANSINITTDGSDDVIYILEKPYQL